MRPAPLSTVLALSWMMLTGILAWLGMLTVLPYAGYGFGLLLAAVIVAPALVVWTGARAAERAGLALLAMVFLIVFMSDTSLRGRAAGDTGLDGQSALKLGLWISGWLLLFWRLAEFRLAAVEKSAGALLVFGVWCMVSTLYSPTRAYTFGASAGFLGMWMIAVHVARRATREQILLTFAAALLLGCLISLGLFAFMRDRAMALTEGGTIFRLAGIFSAPNTLGRAAGLLALVSVLSLFHVRRMLSVPLLAIGGSVALACLYLSASRASLLAFLVAAVVVVLRHRPFLLTVVTALGASALAVVLAFPHILQDVMLLISRTGRVTEVTTFTGRTFIWEWVIAKASAQPLQGYGFASTRVLIPEGYRGPWGFTTTSAHNAWLQAWITVGLVGLAMLAVNHVAMLWKFFRTPDRMRDGLFLYVIVLGLFEASFAGPSINLMTFTWLLASVLPAAGLLRPRRTAQATGIVLPVRSAAWSLPPAPGAARTHGPAD